MKKATLDIDFKKGRVVICDESGVKIENVKRWKAIPPCHLQIVYTNNSRESFELSGFEFGSCELYSQYSPDSPIIEKKKVSESLTEAQVLLEEKIPEDKKGESNTWLSFLSYKEIS